MTQITNRYFIALLPPLEIQAHIRQIQQYFAEHYHSRGALRSPPHITLQAPFSWLSADVNFLQDRLKRFADQRPPSAIALDGFAAFSPRVIYVDVVKTGELLQLHADLLAYCEAIGIVDPVAKARPFAPHITVAFRDLTRQNFKTAWQEFQPQQLHYEFVAQELTLLLHDGQRWNNYAHFPFACRSSPNIN